MHTDTLDGSDRGLGKVKVFNHDELKIISASRVINVAEHQFSEAEAACKRECCEPENNPALTSSTFPKNFSLSRFLLRRFTLLLVSP